MSEVLEVVLKIYHDNENNCYIVSGKGGLVTEGPTLIKALEMAISAQKDLDQSTRTDGGLGRKFL